MLGYTINRVLLTFPILLVLTALAFGLLSLVPGDTTSAILGENASKEAQQAVEHDLGLDRSPVVRYGDWLVSLAHGDLGRSLVTRQDISHEIRRRAPVTFELGVASLVLATLVGIPLGVAAGLHPGTALDRGAMLFAAFGVALPNFFLGLLLVLLFAVQLRWLPATGWSPATGDPLAHFRHLVLPVVTLSMAPVVIVARLIRTGVIGVMTEDYVRTARAKGLSERVVVIRHALRNALIPTVTILGVQLGHILGGTIIVESVFGLPGMGRLALTSVTNHDFPTVQAVVLLLGGSVVMANLTVDLLYALLNPRIRYA